MTVDMQEMLIRWCTVGDSEGVLYHDLVDLLNWNCQPDEDTVLRLTQSSTRPPVTEASDGKNGSCIHVHCSAKLI